jgi:hypothetical protein
MKKIFHEFYRPTEAEFHKMWQDCVFVPDANVLLNLYGYSEKTRVEFLALLKRLSSRLRIPHQFGYEYQRNRAHAIMEQVKNYAKCEKVLENLYTSELLPKNKHPFLSDKMLKEFNKMRQALAKSRKHHEALFSRDPYFDRISAVFANVGQPFPDYEKIHEVCKKRYAVKTPPGYADVKEKGEPGAFGDCIGWLQVLDISKSEKKPVILITDDTKEDWWQIQGDRTIGPRPELIAEFRAICAQAFYMYSSAQFLIHANTYLKEKVNQVAIMEIEERTRERLQTASEKKVFAGPVPGESGVEKMFVPQDETKATAPLKTTVPADSPKATSSRPQKDGSGAS